ncbi:hypothetical protein PIB30_068034 [Stylosanthes scabra]|uniref:C3H1-type domain-containing protein n=1 Tax=Stylosanthes scabra TaxID=79078 RepID=A0ABU6TMI8_9FABA|nr:hypothetical protein [Stylosanthes scabra]
MDVDGGNKRVFHQKVCYHWQAGKCNRHPCPFLHSATPLPPPLTLPPSLPIITPASQGNCGYGERCKFIHSWSCGDGFSLLTQLEGHRKVVSGIALPSASDKLYTASIDETLRVWDCQSGQACNTKLSLQGLVGQVYALVVNNDILFTGALDGSILTWKFTVVANVFEPAASLTGHLRGVVSLVVGANRLYASSMDNTIRVWNLENLQCLQILTDHTSIVMCGLLQKVES